jgi:uncharacterized membrane protein YcaP (DUF421 family)
METLTGIFGEGQNLTILQMCCRGAVIFFMALILIRISGRRSFGFRNPLDNIINISLGAVLSRAIVGASPFLAVLAACLTIVILHRIIGWLIVKNERIATLVDGKKILVYENGKFLHENMKRALLGEEDIRQGVRVATLTDSLQDIERIYLERNGEISAIKKEKE